MVSVRGIVLARSNQISAMSTIRERDWIVVDGSMIRFDHNFGVPRATFLHPEQIWVIARRGSMKPRGKAVAEGEHWRNISAMSSGASLNEGG